MHKNFKKGKGAEKPLTEKMKKILNFNLPEHTNRLYKEEAVSSIGLTHEIAKKINELIDAYNALSADDLKWKQTQEGTIRKGVLYMKDNLINSLRALLEAYDTEIVKSFINEAFGDLFFVTPQKFGAKGDGVTNDREAIQDAINSLTNGGILYFPRGTYLMMGSAVVIPHDNITFLGEGSILCDYGFRPQASNFTAIGVNMEAVEYSTAYRAFMIDNSENETVPSKFIQNFTFKNCSFKNFFYSIYSCGGAYAYDGTEGELSYPVRDIVIENCYSSTYTDKNAGHFQCIQVENISYINNRTYGGQNASSYNAIKGNGYIRVVGNYDHNNSYASCEIENGSGKAVVANNTFNSKIWIDDSFSAVVNGNTAEGGILVTVGSDNGNSENVIISNNVCKNIRCEQFGEYKGGLINFVNITGNNVNGANTHGIWVHGNAVIKANIANNFISGVNTNDISVQRNAQLKCYIHNNIGSGKTLLIAGSGGAVYAFDNSDLVSSGTRDALSVSHLEKAFNGVKITDTNGVAWRLNVGTNGSVSTVKY